MLKDSLLLHIIYLYIDDNETSCLIMKLYKQNDNEEL